MIGILAVAAIALCILAMIRQVIQIASEFTAQARITAIEEKMDKANGKLARQSVTLEAWKVRMSRQFDGLNSKLDAIEFLLVAVATEEEEIKEGETAGEHFENYTTTDNGKVIIHEVDGEEVKSK